jgi:hypothetical protein
VYNQVFQNTLFLCVKTTENLEILKNLIVTCNNNNDYNENEQDSINVNIVQTANSN